MIEELFRRGSKTLTPRKLIGRASTGAERGKGRLVHAVEDQHTWPRFYPALCGAKPGRRSAGWSETIETEVTCPKCKRKET